MLYPQSAFTWVDIRPYDLDLMGGGICGYCNLLAFNGVRLAFGRHTNVLGRTYFRRSEIVTMEQPRRLRARSRTVIASGCHE